MKLIGLAELAELYGVSKNTASTWSRQRDWPAPVTTLKMGPIWDQDEIEAHKTPASKQRFQIRCGKCYSDAISPRGVNLDLSFTVECGACGRRSTFEIQNVSRPDNWPTTVISVRKPEEMEF
jgi:hypothetical protein